MERSDAGEYRIHGKEARIDNPENRECRSADEHFPSDSGLPYSEELRECWFRGGLVAFKDSRNAPEVLGIRQSHLELSRQVLGNRNCSEGFNERPDRPRCT